MDLKNILNEQSSFKVVLNGGKLVLDDATVPFQIAFDKSIMEQNPTHILVIDVTDGGFSQSSGARWNHTGNAERSLFKLEPTNYLQFHKPGVHHLIFMLVRDGMDKYRVQKFLGKSSYSYENDMQYDAIEKNCAVFGQIAYVEVIVEVPKEFFASKSKTKFGKAFYNWNNRWFDLEPIDQCQNRKRMFVSLTIQPIIWLFLSLIRFIVATFVFIAMLAFRIICLIFGLQFVHLLFNNIEVLFIDFVVLYPAEDYHSVFRTDTWEGKTLSSDQTAKDSKASGDAYEYKILSIFGKKLYTPITIGGLIVYSSLLLLYVPCVHANLFPHTGNIAGNLANLFASLVVGFTFAGLFSNAALPTLKKDEEYQSRWNRETSWGKKRILKAFWWIAIPLASAALVPYLVLQINWMIVFHILATFVSIMIIFGLLSFSLIYALTACKLWGKVFKVIWKIMSPVVWLLDKILYPFVLVLYFLFQQKKKEQKETKSVEKLNPREAWLEKSFDLKTLPQKVNVFNAPKPSTKIHVFRVSFWSLKAKVCKPFAK